MVIVPVRAALVLDATRYETVPDPAPEFPAVIVIQLALLTAFQVAFVGLAVRDTLPLPPVAEKLADELVRENTAVAAAWTTLSVLPAIVTVPLREASVLFDATV